MPEGKAFEGRGLAYFSRELTMSPRSLDRLSVIVDREKCACPTAGT